MIKTCFLIFTLGFLGLQISGQEVINISASQLDENIVRISYDLNGEIPGQLFTVNLYSSANQFSLPLEYVDGYVGEQVEAGVNKFIDWDISKELVAFNGEISFEVKATLTFTPIHVAFPEANSLKRGKQHYITWKGTNTNEHVDIQLFREATKVATIANTVNDGLYEWEVPYSTKPGKGYSVKISSTTSSQSDIGDEFSIHRKIPLLVKLIPFAIAAPVVINLTEEEPPVPKLLPAPPNAPN